MAKKTVEFTDNYFFKEIENRLKEINKSIKGK